MERNEELMSTLYQMLPDSPTDTLSPEIQHLAELKQNMLAAAAHSEQISYGWGLDGIVSVFSGEHGDNIQAAANMVENTKESFIQAYDHLQETGGIHRIYTQLQEMDQARDTPQARPTLNANGEPYVMPTEAELTQWATDALTTYRGQFPDFQVENDAAIRNIVDYSKLLETAEPGVINQKTLEILSIKYMADDEIRQHIDTEAQNYREQHVSSDPDIVEKNGILSTYLTNTLHWMAENEAEIEFGGAAVGGMLDGAIGAAFQSGAVGRFALGGTAVGTVAAGGVFVAMDVANGCYAEALANSTGVLASLAAGITSGAVAGAAVGSVVPGAGTFTVGVVGAFAGGVGGTIGYYGGKRVGGEIAEHFNLQSCAAPAQAPATDVSTGPAITDDRNIAPPHNNSGMAFGG